MRASHTVADSIQHPHRTLAPIGRCGDLGVAPLESGHDFGNDVAMAAHHRTRGQCVDHLHDSFEPLPLGETIIG